MKLTEIKIELENVKNLGLCFYFQPGWMLKNPKIQVENKKQNRGKNSKTNSRAQQIVGSQRVACER